MEFPESMSFLVMLVPGAELVEKFLAGVRVRPLNRLCR